MRRTAIRLVAFALVLFSVPIASHAQQGGRVYRLGILRPTAPLSTDDEARISAALGDLGYVDGQNLVVERRYAQGKMDRLPELARELVRARVDAIVAVSATAVRAAKGATTTIPIIMWGLFDPVSEGLVASLARPGTNVTGALIAADGTLAAKRLELLRESVPRAPGIAALFDNASLRAQVDETQRAAKSLGITLTITEVQGGDYESAFASMAATRPSALFVAGSTFFFRDRKRIIELAAKHRLPAIYEWPEQARDGGLMAYGTDLQEGYRRIASYIDRILKGAKPGDLPVEQPTKFALVINLKTARALGLAIPQSLLQRADEVIR
jgi:putative ABC transport system substrate-binding protein